MANIVFIGDEVTAAGYRLAGVEVFSPPKSGLSDLVVELGRTSEVMIITAEYIGYLPEDKQQNLMESSRPLVSIIPDIRNRVSPPDMEKSVRRVLGIEE